MLTTLERQLTRRKILGNLRSLKITPSLIDFASNDYLGLARSEKLAESTLEEWARQGKTQNGLGSTGSRLLTGNSLYAQELEEKIAAFHGYETALLFSCGYMANLGLLSAIGGEGDSIFFDTRVHASTHDGIRLSRANGFPFMHNDLDHLENRLKNSLKGNRFICIESIYSTDGSKAPLQEISELSKKYGAHLIVDEAHAIGISGPNGKGLVEEHKLTKDVFALIITFGKALGTYGAAILGSHFLKQCLINFARTSIYTTALPNFSLAAINCSYDLFPAFEEQRRHLFDLIEKLQKYWPGAPSTPIQPLKIKGNENVRRLAHHLQSQGFDVRPLMNPTVPRGHEMLRICLHAYNTPVELSALLEGIEEYRSCNGA